MALPNQSPRRTLLSLSTLAIAGCTGQALFSSGTNSDCSHDIPLWEPEEWRVPNYDVHNTSQTELSVKPGRSPVQQWTSNLFEAQQELSAIDSEQVSPVVLVDGHVYTTVVHPSSRTLQRTISREQ